MTSSGKAFKDKIIVVTGANSFIGKPLCVELIRQGKSVRAAVRSSNATIDNTEAVVVGAIGGETDWTDALRDVEVIIHLAARVHVMRENAENPLEEFRKVNVAGTERLARLASASGVKRLVYVSSIGVNGLRTEPSSVFSETGSTNPHNAYTISKWEAEQSLFRVSEETGLDVVIVRPPLVYGVGAPGNAAQMLSVLAKRIPLPLASIENRRSLIYVMNLVDALITCATHPAAAGQVYLVSDGEDVSTPDLLRHLGAAMGHPPRLFSCPPILLKLIGCLMGKTEQVERLSNSLRVDSSKIRRELGWIPPYTLEQGLRETADWYRYRRD